MIFMKKAVFIVFILSITFFSNTDSNSVESSRNFISEKRFLLIIDFYFLSCPLCKQSLEKCIDVINTNGLEKSVLGVLIFDREKIEIDFEKYTKIMKKKLRGFIIGNDIKFPILLDRNGVFKNLNPDAGFLILFDTQNEIIKKYEFPLSRAQFNEIFQNK